MRQWVQGRALSCLALWPLLAAGFALHASATTIVWTNTADGDWSDASNWNPNQVPGQLNGATNADDVWITNAGTYTVTLDQGTPPNSWSIHSLTLGAGNSNGVQTVAITGKAFYANALTATQGGVLAETGGSVHAVFTLENGGQLNSVNSTNYGGPLTLAQGGQMMMRGNYGVATFHGSILVENGGTLTIAGGIDGSVEVARDAALTVAGGGSVKFHDIAGPYGLETATLALYGRLSNSGSIYLGDDAIALHNDGTANSLGFLQNLPGGTIQLASGIAAGSIATALHGGPDDKFINQGVVVNAAGGSAISVSDFDSSAGLVTNLAGTLSLGRFSGTLAGTFRANRGATIRFNGGTGSAPVTPGHLLAFGSDGAYQFASGWLDLRTATLSNLDLVGGLLTLEPTFEGGAITNLTLRGTTLSNAPGVLWPVAGGTFTMTDSAVHGDLAVKAGGEMNVVRDQFGTPTFFGNVTVDDGGSLNANAVFNGHVSVNGVCRITGGAGASAMNGSMTVGASGTLDLEYLFYANSPLTNFGTINLAYSGDSGNLLLVNNGRTAFGSLLNEPGGRINLLSQPGAIISSSGLSSDPHLDYFLNQGEIVNSNSSGVINVMNFTNSGSIISDTGTLNQNHVVLQPTSTLIAELNSATDYGKLTIVGNAALNGTLAVRFNNGFTPAFDQPFTLLSYASDSGSFASLDLPNSVEWQRINGETAFTVVPRRELAITLLAPTNAVLHVSVDPGTEFTVLSSSSLLAPFSQWAPVITNTEDVSGYFSFTNAADLPKEFFLLRFP